MPDQSVHELAAKFGGQAVGNNPQPANGDVRSLAAQFGGTPVAGAPATPAANQTGYFSGTDEELIRQFGYDPKEIQGSFGYQLNKRLYGSGLQFLVDNPNREGLMRALTNMGLADLGKGVVDIARGPHQFATHVLNKFGAVSDADTKYIDLMNRIFEENFNRNITRGAPSTGLQIAGSAAVPGGRVSANAGRLRTAAETVALGAAGGASQPVNSGEDFFTEKAKQTAAGAVAAPVIGAVASGTGKMIGKTVNAIRGQMSPEARAVVEAGQKYEVPLTYGDITRKPGAQKHEVRMEEVPGLGMADFRQGQHDKARAAALKIAEDLKQAFKGQKPAAIQDIELAAKQGDDYARKILDQIRNAGDDPDRVMQAAIGLQDFRTKAEAEQLYNKIAYLVTKNGLAGDDVPLGGFRDALQWAMGDTASAVIKNKPVISLLREIEGSLAGDQPMTFDRARRLRSDLSRIIRSYRENENTIIGKEGVGYLERLRGALEGDMQEFVDQAGVPEIQAAARAADEYYKNSRVPFKDALLTYASNMNEPDQIFQLFIQAGKGDRAQKFYDAIDPRAQAALRYSMVQRAIEKATDETKDIFSPAKFSGYLNKLSEPYGVFFKGRDKWEMDGLRNVMSHVTRAGQYAENPPTGNRLLGGLVSLAAPGVLGGVATQNPTAAAAGFGLSAAVNVLSRFLLTTEPGKRYLLASSTLKPGSPAMQRLLDEISEKFPAVAGKAAGRETGR
jgi:hypothetical protein